MINSLPPYILYIASIVISAVISGYAVKKIIFITRQKNIFDIPDNIRKIHGAQIPSLGGIGIFIGYMMVLGFFMFQNTGPLSYVIISSVLLFFTGVYDDIMNMRPVKKLISQLLASAISIYFLYTGAEGAGLNELLAPMGIPSWVVVSGLTICCTFFINAFNFVDGIDGLACSLAILYTAIIGSLFAATGQTAIGCILFSLSGATLGLLYYNRPPAKIYMGDTGSMLLGFTIFIFAARFVSTFSPGNLHNAVVQIHSRGSVVIILVAVLFLPMYDAIRVFILRASRGISPLKADRTHLHYYLLDAGFSHGRSVVIILATNVLLIVTGFLMQDANPFLTLLFITLESSALMFGVYRLRGKKIK